MAVEFNLDRNLCFFDLEATGLNVVKDKIVQLALVIYYADGSTPMEISMLINPGIPIPPDISDIHGITDEMVRNKPSFSDIAQSLLNTIGDADLAGYNSNRFDVPMLLEEFANAGYDFPMENRRTLDMQAIFHKMEPRTLRAAYRYYCGERLENAHDALVDVKATVEVFKSQLERYEGQDLEDDDGNIIEAPIRNDMQAIHDFSMDNRVLDFTRRIKLNTRGVPVFAFGKYINKPVGETLMRDPNYYNWLMDKEFPSQMKKIVTDIYRDHKRQAKQNQGS